MHCPHCRAPSAVRSSEELSPLLRLLYFRCRNDMCGHVFIAHLEAVRTVSPSAIPNPEIQLPLSPHIRRAALLAQLDMFQEPTP
jgi:hypothetical protein